MLSRDTLCYLLIVYHILDLCFECANLVKCFAGNRDFPLLHLFLIGLFILPSEILSTYRLYISTTVVYLFVVYSSPPLHGEVKAIEVKSHLL
jgi:hypothetical protein